MTVIYILLCLVCLILIALVLMQDSKSGLGGLTGGTTMSAFGANTDKALIKATAIFGTLFFVLVIVIHLVKKSDSESGSLMPKAAEVKKESVTVPPVTLGEKKPDAHAEKAPAPEAKESKEAKGTTVTIPLKDVKDTTPAESGK